MEIEILYCQMVQTALVVCEIYNVTRQPLNILKSRSVYEPNTVTLKNEKNSFCLVLFCKYNE
jgi:hypothetical protein